MVAFTDLLMSQCPSLLESIKVQVLASHDDSKLRNDQQKDENESSEVMEHGQADEEDLKKQQLLKKEQKKIKLEALKYYGFYDENL